MSEALLPDPVSVTVRAPAKINVYLGVGKVRPDGFHPLETVYQAVSLYDDVTVTSADEWSVTTSVQGVHVDGTAVPDDDTNIALRAGKALVAHHRLDDRAAEIQISKSIPVAGGMAGGSADAAATLVALDRLWSLGTSDEELLAIGAELGSDVPFALVGGTALGVGRGEVVSPLLDEATRWWVAVPAGAGLSTPAVYRHFDELWPEAPGDVTVPVGLTAALQDPDSRSLATMLHNDLEAVAIDLRPELGELVEDGERAGALRGIVSGSGPTCLFLCSDRGSADRVRTTLVEAGHPRVLVALGPVSGTHVVEYS